MVKGSALVLACIITFVLPCAAQGQTNKAIFRHINLGKNGALRLAESFDRKEELSDKIGTNIYKLRKDVFGGASSLEVHLNDDDKIIMMHFEYSPDTNYSAAVKSYSNILGPPIREDNAPTTTKLTWDDGKTCFEYVRVLENDKWKIYSILYDKNLQRH